MVLTGRWYLTIQLERWVLSFNTHNRSMWSRSNCFPVVSSIHFEHSLHGHGPSTVQRRPIDHPVVVRPQGPYFLLNKWNTAHESDLDVRWWTKRKISTFFFFFLVGGKEGNASCTVGPLSTVCGTPARLAVGPMSPLDKNCRLT